MSRLVHLFNSSIVSGPENLVLRNLAGRAWPMEIWNLEESRTMIEGGHPLARLAKRRGFLYRPLLVASRWDPEAVGLLRETLLSEKIEVVHAHDVKATVFALAALRGVGSRRPRLLSTHHGIDGRPDLKTKLYERFYRHIVLPRCDLALAVSVDDEEALRQSPRLAPKLRLHRNGLEGRARTGEERIRERAEARKAWGVPVEATVLGYVGRLSVEKDPAKALETFAALGGSAHFVVAGVGIEEAALRAQAQSLGVADRVKFVGYRGSISDELAGFDLLLCLSRAEGLPLLLLEAAWAATPVLAHRVGGMSEVLVGLDTRLLAEPTDSPSVIAAQARSLLEDPAALDAAGNELQARVMRDFSGEAWRHTLAGFYSELGMVLDRY